MAVEDPVTGLGFGESVTGIACRGWVRERIDGCSSTEDADDMMQSLLELGRVQHVDARLRDHGL